MRHTKLIEHIKKQTGFTLVELLISIAIIAVLTVIAVASFAGVQKNARDSKRKADINAIANAMETQYNQAATGKYSGLSDSFFSSGGVPKDPIDSQYGCGNSTSGDSWQKTCWYCNHTDGHTGLCSSPDSTVRVGNPTNNTTTWAICANLESPPGYYCIKNQQ